MKNKATQTEVKQAATSNHSGLNKQAVKEALPGLQKQLKDIPVYKRYSFNGTVGGYQGL